MMKRILNNVKQQTTNNYNKQRINILYNKKNILYNKKIYSILYRIICQPVVKKH